MKNRIIAIAILCCLPLGCAVLLEQAKKDEYERTMDSYSASMQLSDVNTLCQYIDPAEMGRKDCLKRYEKVKIVGYETLRIKVSEDKLKVKQTVEMEYYILDRYIVKKLEHEQTWRYQEDSKTWILETGPPDFNTP